jgi:hypothetical protein
MISIVHIKPFLDEGSIILLMIVSSFKKIFMTQASRSKVQNERYMGCFLET